MSPSHQFYILRDGAKVAPLTEEEILDSLDLGDISPDDECIDSLNGQARRVGDVFQIVVNRSQPAPEKGIAKVPANEMSEATPVSTPPAVPSPTTRQKKKPESASKKRARDILYFGHPSFVTYWRSLAFAIGAAIGGYYGSSYYSGYFGLAGWLLSSLTVIYVIISRSCRDFLVTPLRVELVEGLVSKSSREVRIEDIRAINVKTRGLIGLLGVGTVEFASAGSDSVDVAFENVGRAHRVKKLVRRVQDQAEINSG